MTGINRRSFCQLLGSAVLLPQLAIAGQRPKPLFASAAKDKQGRHHLYLIGNRGELLLDHPLPARAHHTEVHPHQPLLACVARRPGTFVDIIDYHSRTMVSRIIAAPGRHFFGHGIFSEDGRYLITTENEIRSGQGRVVIREVEDSFRIIADFTSAGIGPHELIQQSGSHRLLVANGGILTHPESGRKKLNLDSMQPSLAVFDINSGRLLEQQFMPDVLHKLSIRHMDTNGEGTTIIALQFQGGAEENPPLVAIHRPDQPLKLIPAPEPINRAMKRYCGSARFDSSGRYAAVSAPRGDMITFWDLSTDSFHSQLRSRDGCGVAPSGNDGGFLITSGTGRCLQHNLITGAIIRLPHSIKPAWDNHMATFS